MAVLGEQFIGGGSDKAFGQDLLQNLSFLVQSPFFGFVTSFLQAEKNQERQDKFDEEQRELKAEGEADLFPALDNLLATTTFISAENLAATEQRAREAPGRFEAVANPLLAGGRQIVSGVEALGQEGRADDAQTLSDQRAREQELRAEREGLGDAERAELNRSFGAFGRTQQARLSGLGLGGTTAAASVAGGVQSLRSRELGLLNERLQREQLDFSERISGETLTFQDLTNQRSLGLGRDTLEAQSGLLGFQTQLGFAGLDFREQSAENQLLNREKFTLAPALTALAGAERRNQFRFEDVIHEPPILPDTQNLAFLSQQQG